MSAPARSPGWVRGVDLGLRTLGGVVVLALALLTAALELILVPVRVGGIPVGLCLLVAVVVNSWLPGYAVAVTDARWPMLVAFVAWLAVMMIAAGRRDEGDLLATGALALLTNVVGSLAFGFAIYRQLVPPSPAPATPVDDAVGAGPVAAGSAQ